MAHAIVAIKDIQKMSLETKLYYDFLNVYSTLSLSSNPNVPFFSLLSFFPSLLGFKAGNISIFTKSHSAKPFSEHILLKFYKSMHVE